VQECRFTTPSQDAGMKISGCRNDSTLQSRWDTDSSALILQTQQNEIDMNLFGDKVGML
jgi:hypothetical protein